MATSNSTAQRKMIEAQAILCALRSDAEARINVGSRGIPPEFVVALADLAYQRLESIAFEDLRERKAKGGRS